MHPFESVGLEVGDAPGIGLPVPILGVDFGTQAAQSDVKPGDVIYAINGKNCTGLSAEMCASLAAMKPEICKLTLDHPKPRKPKSKKKKKKKNKKKKGGGKKKK
jgi:C-terminal processing protease CtpA/Prc